MARKSRKNVVPAAPMEKPAEKVWHAALYIRLSVEFNSKRGDSLETQKQIMEAYLALFPDIEIVQTYTDNGITGRTFERAAFQEMLRDVESGKINCIVVKDLSRLGRNTIDTGYYIEKYFPLHQVRFIAVNDQYDSEDADNSGNHLIVPLKNMINEAYAADISKKVRAQQQQAMKDGEFVGSRPPYGYKKAPENCHKLLVNEETAPVVQKIFQWAAEGVSMSEIVRRLNEEKILTPGYYLASIGLITNRKLMGSGKWQSWTVAKILEDEVYTGDMVQGKSKAVGHKQVLTNPDEWIVVPNTHEALISHELFAQVQNTRNQTAEKYTQKPKKLFTPNILRGRVVCGHCGKNLNRQQSHGRYYYRCISNDRMGKNSCTGDIRYLRETELFDAILTIIRQKADTVIGKNFYLKQADRKIAAQKAQTDKEISDLQLETAKNRKVFASLYESFVSGLLTRAEYIEMQASYSQKISAAAERVRLLQERQQKLEAQMAKYASLADRLSKVTENTELTAALVDQVIERITVNSSDDISIEFQFEHGFDLLKEVLSDE